MRILNLILNLWSAKREETYFLHRASKWICCIAKKYAKLSIDYSVNYFQILHTQEAPCCEQNRHEDKEKQDSKEANQEKDAAN